MRLLGQSSYFPSDTTIVARGFSTPYMNENSPAQRTGSNSGTEDNDMQSIYPQFITGSSGSSQRPLPPVPCSDTGTLALQ